MNHNYPDEREWDGILHLNDLFKSEVIPPGTKDSQYFDQRYIDYLQNQNKKLDKIHWRQFEFLTGEYFRRIGYNVEITPPRGDGGIDVLAKKMDSELGPELVVAQCKRYGQGKLVSINDTKAFWADINDKNATRGLIITTSALESGAKKFCRARKYKISSVEFENVEKWINSLATFKK